ncbi:hypothetical protein [uncultured Duncaniella sp.]|jgi:hypothetical protein|uniref:hypothetical protein n=1 Tax=uncultured Duncaniella sp. TaxID=2768039 RepID=UPI002609E52F|nr:hypothetical protein [uncultured Duncaniella sp.]
MAKKRKSVPIASIGDLIDLVNHNCELFDRRTRKLAKGNRNLKVLCLMAIGYAIYTGIQCRKQEEQIYQLSVKMNKLEQSEGE